MFEDTFEWCSGLARFVRRFEFHGFRDKTPRRLDDDRAPRGSGSVEDD